MKKRIQHFFLLLILLSAFSGEAATKQKPNILFIMVDDLGKEWISCYGAQDIKTPHIDALAAGGMKFNNAYSMPKCTPTRTTLLSGQYPWRTGWVNHWDVPRWGVGYFDWRKNITFARLLKEQGYTTCVAGKWQLNDFRLEPLAMQKHGFDAWCMWTGSETGVAASSSRYWDPYIHTQEGTRVYKGQFGPDIFTDFIIDFMQQHKDQPMCIYYPMVLVHSPPVSPPGYHANGHLAQHKAMVEYVDHLVGRLVESLDELGLRENTYIFFTTDNGTSGKLVGTLQGRKIKGGKGETSENGICEPFIVNAPGRVPAGVTTDALTDFTDILPTFLDLAGATPPADLPLDGISLLPVLSGKQKESSRQWILAMGHGKAAVDEKGIHGTVPFCGRVLRDQRFKVWVSEDRQITALYDLQADPDEKINLLHDPRPECQAALKKFQAVLNQFPSQDARPAYTPRAPNPWDKKPTPRQKSAQKI